jgi:hypothetical protein
MKNQKPKWNKTELQVYILLLCANADKKETEEELALIQAKVPKDIFKKMYEKFHKHSEEKRLKKISRHVNVHFFTNMELIDFRREVYNIFLSDGTYTMMEKRLDWTLDNILY